jgi:hypothetical protein
VLVAGVVFVVACRPDPGTARYVAAHVHDPTDDCGAPDFGALWDPELAAWRRRAEKSSSFACGAAGPVVQWARFRSIADLEAALRAVGGAPRYVCRTDRKELIRFIGFPASSEAATCGALHGHRV